MTELFEIVLIALACPFGLVMMEAEEDETH